MNAKMISYNLKNKRGWKKSNKKQRRLQCTAADCKRGAMVVLMSTKQARIHWL